MDTVSKDKHCLTEKDLSLKDKMNYLSVEKINDLKVTNLLKQYVPNSKATVLYLEIIILFWNSSGRNGSSSTNL